MAAKDLTRYGSSIYRRRPDGSLSLFKKFDDEIKAKDYMTDAVMREIHGFKGKP